ncbi:hypothetical protein BKI52_20880 [marine bacterium AO1-C]|nr:hypothetical protein BKI52_20880 [marine bacterium AO1-C]
MRLHSFKYFGVFSFVFITSLPSVWAQNSTQEMKAIRQTLMYYITNTNMQKAFHEQAQLKFVRDGKYSQISANDFVKRVGNGPARPKNSIAITQLDIAGNAAFAKLTNRSKGRIVTDYMSLLKMDGKWVIVSKVFSMQKVDPANNNSKAFKHDGPVWAVNQMRLRKASDYEDYMKCLQYNWAAARTEGKRQGYINSYQVLALPPTQMADKIWNVLLITEYPNQQRMKAFEKDFAKIAKKATPKGLVKIKGKAPRDFADIVNYHTFIDTIHSKD